MLPRALRFKRPLHRCNACNPDGRLQNRDTKAELNRRGQACEVLTGTGISHRGKGIPSALNPGLGHYFDRAGSLPVDRIHLGNGLPSRSLGEGWTGMRVARPLLRFGRPACIYEHLCPKIGIPCWNRTSLCGFAGRRLNCSANGMKG